MATLPERAWQKHPKLLMPFPQDGPYDTFKLAVAVAFDLEDQAVLLHELTNRDLLWMPTDDGYDGRLNAFQFISRVSTSQREPVLSTFSYLFQRREPYYQEPYDRTPAERAALKAVRARVRDRYGTAQAYVHCVLTILMADHEDADFYTDMVQKACFRAAAAPPDQTIIQTPP